MRCFLRFVACGLLVSLLLAVTGCGGGSSSSGSTSRFASVYAGSFLDPANVGNIGTVRLTVGSNGSLTGTVAYSDTPVTATLSGTVVETGDATLVVVHQDSTHTVATGMFALDGAGHLDGALRNIMGIPVTVTAMNSAQPLSYAGSFAGTAFRSDTNQSFSVTMTISSTGALTGTENAIGGPTTFTGTVSKEGFANITSANIFGTSTFPWAVSFDASGHVLLQYSDNGGGFTTITLTRTN